MISFSYPSWNEFKTDMQNRFYTKMAIEDKKADAMANYHNAMASIAIPSQAQLYKQQANVLTPAQAHSYYQQANVAIPAQADYYKALSEQSLANAEIGIPAQAAYTNAMAAQIKNTMAHSQINPELMSDFMRLLFPTNSVNVNTEENEYNNMNLPLFNNNNNSTPLFNKFSLLLGGRY